MDIDFELTEEDLKGIDARSSTKVEVTKEIPAPSAPTTKKESTKLGQQGSLLTFFKKK